MNKWLKNLLIILVFAVLATIFVVGKDFTLHDYRLFVQDGINVSGGINMSGNLNISDGFINCQNIDGGTDTDFCVDATGGISAAIQNDTDAELITLDVEQNATINRLNITLDVVIGGDINVTGNINCQDIDGGTDADFCVDTDTDTGLTIAVQNDTDTKFSSMNITTSGKLGMGSEGLSFFTVDSSGNIDVW